MRLRFWRREEPQWCDLNVDYGWPDGRQQDGVGRKRHVPIGSDDLYIALMVGVAEVQLTVGYVEYCVLWCELDDFPSDASTLHADVNSLLRKCGYANRGEEGAAQLILEELNRLVTGARLQRDQRLRMLPAAAPIRWDELSQGQFEQPLSTLPAAAPVHRDSDSSAT